MGQIIKNLMPGESFFSTEFNKFLLKDLTMSRAYQSELKFSSKINRSEANILSDNSQKLRELKTKTF